MESEPESCGCLPLTQPAGTDRRTVLPRQACSKCERYMPNTSTLKNTHHGTLVCLPCSMWKTSLTCKYDLGNRLYTYQLFRAVAIALIAGSSRFFFPNDAKLHWGCSYVCTRQLLSRLICHHGLTGQCSLEATWPSAGYYSPDLKRSSTDTSKPLGVELGLCRPDDVESGHLYP